MKNIKFTVDSALLQELGERLVGKPHIALAELIKNSYDADATRVLINFGEDRIDIIDSGHGMDLTEFKGYWMRIGSQHKKSQRYSRIFQRSVTGSKGVGRLAVQFLAKQIEISTVSINNPEIELNVKVNWDDAVKAGDLTKANALYEEVPTTTKFPEDATSGTKIVLKNLNQDWTPKLIGDLAEEIWPLQPPFLPPPSDKFVVNDVFNVSVESPNEKASKEFDQNMKVWLDLWEGKISGRLVNNEKGNGSKEIELIIEYLGGTDKKGKRVPQFYIKERYPIKKSNLHYLNFEIRVFHLSGRQPHGIKVDDMRDYFKKHGGVHVYDAGFHLPYYGSEGDWLGISRDHARRASKSDLLPEHLQIERGLHDLPANPRIFGVVNVNTGEEYNLSINEERDLDGEYLQIQVSRDRLVDNKAYQTLRDAVRYSLDYYATEKQRGRAKELEANRPIEPISQKFKRIEEVIKQYKEEIPKHVYKPLLIEVKGAIEASKIKDNLIDQRTGVLGALATAGMAALAYEHEAKKMRTQLGQIAKNINKVKVPDTQIQKELSNIADSLFEWRERSKATQSLFLNLNSHEDRTLEVRLKAIEIIENIESQLGNLMRGIKISTKDLDPTLKLPKAKYIEWGALFQNVILNSVNALLDSEKPTINISSNITKNAVNILIQDNGVGVDLIESEKLFEPFERRMKISDHRKELGAGGTGLGLTIVRMIAENLNCSVSFIKPEKEFKTAFNITWRELNG